MGLDATGYQDFHVVFSSDSAQCFLSIKNESQCHVKKLLQALRTYHRTKNTEENGKDRSNHTSRTRRVSVLFPAPPLSRLICEFSPVTLIDLHTRTRRSFLLSYSCFLDLSPTNARQKWSQFRQTLQWYIFTTDPPPPPSPIKSLPQEISICLSDLVRLIEPFPCKNPRHNRHRFCCRGDQCFTMTQNQIQAKPYIQSPCLWWRRKLHYMPPGD